MSVPARARPERPVVEPRPPRGRGRSWWRRRRRLRLGRRGRVALAGIVLLVALVALGSYLVDEPLRRYVEARMNARMTGYSARIERLSFHPLGASLTLRNLVMIQHAHPDPPVLLIERLDASVQWKALIFGRLVADFRVERPAIYADRQHLEREARDPTPLREHGWQDAFQEIYPLEINRVKIVEGAITYVDDTRFDPLRLSRVQITAENIRNIRSRDRVYPSEIRAEAIVFDRGRLSIDGRADFLAVPHLGVKAAIALADVDLDRFRPLSNRANVALKGGTLSARGRVEWGPTIKLAELEHAAVRGIHVDYIHTQGAADAPREAAAKTERATRQAARREDMLLRVRHFEVTEAEVGLVNRAATPPYRLFLRDAHLEAHDLSNRLNEGIGRVSVRGRFMGSGATDVRGTFRPEQRGPDFDVDLKIENTDMRSMNDLLRAYGKFDVVRGTFSLYSELRVQQGAVTGYVKPLFRDVKAFDPEQDRDEGFLRRLWERIVGGASKLLRNVPRREVATRVDISGSLDDPRASTLQALGGLIRNAFFRAILPGFERQGEPPPSRRASARANP